MPEAPRSMQIVHGRAEHATAEARTGTVYGDPVLPSADGTTVNSVTFTPGARTSWHHHEGGRLLIGHRRERVGVCPRGGTAAAHRGRPGLDLAGRAALARAGPGSILTHTAISLGSTTWLDEVSAAEYPWAR